ncbi:MAG: hypothetical protein EPN39_18090 [Chitinophagaceae bacterium]|nr:MAG: hypothetical protein EPN39_18090 [Chitinophagaceae bacterium]
MSVIINYFHKAKWSLPAIAILFLVNACKKENLSSPVVTGLRAISPAPNDSTLTRVIPGQIVVIKGYNLNGLQQVLFDGYQASVNTALNTNGTIVITVPSGILFTSLSADVANTIKVITTHGETVYKFDVVPPPPVITSISNEFAHGGDTITITGSYLYTVQSVIFPGDNTVSSGFISDSTGASLQVIVPNGITPGDADSLVVETEGGTGKAAFNNTYGMIADFEWGSPTFGWQYWGGIMGSDAAKFPDGWGNYIEINPTGTINANDNSWWTNNRAVMIAGSAWVVNGGDPVTNYALKFQMFVKDPWTNGSLMITTSAQKENGNSLVSKYVARYAPEEQTSSGIFQTNGWITVTIPLSEIKSTDDGGNYDASGSPAPTMSDLMGGSSSVLQMMLFNDSSSPLSSFDAAFDNVRIVKIK